jgi:hypothetical protein
MGVGVLNEVYLPVRLRTLGVCLGMDCKRCSSVSSDSGFLLILAVRPWPHSACPPGGGTCESDDA